MVGEEGRPGKKLKKAVKVKKAERPPANPVVDVSTKKVKSRLDQDRCGIDITLGLLSPAHHQV